jgi:hypothetical protein
MSQIRERSAAADTRPKKRSSVGVGVAATAAYTARSSLRMSSRQPPRDHDAAVSGGFIGRCCPPVA